jgi:hypothetical protein
MTTFQGNTQMSGTVSIRRVGAQRAPLSWRVANVLRWAFIWGLMCHAMARAFTRVTGVKTLLGELSVKLHKADGTWIDYGIVSRRLVTDAFAAFLVDDWDGGANDVSLFNFHGVGTGTTAESAAHTALVTESTTILTVDSTRATGVKTQPSAPVMQSVGTISFDGSGAITEHAVFTQAATGGGTMMDRSLFAAINVASGDSIVATYQLTITAGG